MRKPTKMEERKKKASFVFITHNHLLKQKKLLADVSVLFQQPL